MSLGVRAAARAARARFDPAAANRRARARPTRSARSLHPSIPTPGAVYALPAGYRAYKLPQAAPTACAPPDGAPPGVPATAWSAAASYDAVTYWKLDEHPGLHDGQRRALDALTLAEQVRTLRGGREGVLGLK